MNPHIVPPGREVPPLATATPREDTKFTRSRSEPGKKYPDYLLSSGASVNVDNVPSDQLEFDYVISTTARLSDTPIAERRFR
jgi:hypothetical protein